MIYSDKIYGKINIAEPVIVELIKCPEIQRLKGINQYGYMGSYLPEAKTTRFEHSLGVFCLLRKFGASLEEQIAGLIHDVSHSAFSHCIDYALKGKNASKQSHQDDILEEYIKKTEIPKILKKFKISLGYILDDNNFPLKENHTPNICADRIDYLLRDAKCFKMVSKKKIDYFLNNLKARNGQWFFGNYQSARSFTKLFYKMNRKYYSGLPTSLMFRTTGDFLKYALDKEYISENDLYKTDREVLDKIKKNSEKDRRLNLLWKRMNKQIKYGFSKFGGMSVACKSRAINPFFLRNGKLLRISDIDKNWKKTVKKESKPKEYFIKFHE